VTIGNQSCHKIDQEIGHAAVASVFDLGNVFQLVVDGFDDRPLPQQHFVGQGHEAVLHVLAHRGDEFNAMFKELLEELLRDIAFVAKEFTEQVTHETRHRLAVIDIAGREMKGQEFAAIIDDQVQFEAIEPAHRRFAPLRQPVEHLVTRDAAIVEVDKVKDIRNL